MPRIPANRPTPADSPAVAVLDLDAPPAAVRRDPPQRPAVPRPAAPPTPPAAMPESIVRRNQELRDAEKILIRKVDGCVLEPEEESFLGWLFGDEYAIAHQLQRVRKYRTAQRAAGTAADRDAAKSHAEQTAKQYATEGPRLQERIAELQRQLAAIEQAADKARTTTEKHDAALIALADFTLLNDPDRLLYVRRRQNWERDYGRPVRMARQEAEGLLTVAGLDPGQDSDKIGVYAQTAKLHHLTITNQPRRPGEVNETRDRRYVTVNVAAWQAHVIELRQRAADLNAEADSLDQAGAAAKAELDSMLASLIPA